MGTIRTAACLGIGSELLGTDRLDSNSLEITARLEALGIEVVAKGVADDTVEGITAMLACLASRADLVVTTGGLGPTADDVTREALAAWAGRPLVEDAALAAAIRERYRAHGREMPPFALKMARLVEGATPLPNPRGAAAGMMLVRDGAVVAVLPGVPHEMREILESELVPRLRTMAAGERILRRTLFLSGVYESDVERRIAPLYDRFGRTDVTVLCSAGTLRIVLRARGTQAEAARRLDEMTAAFSEAVGDDLAAVDRDDLAGIVVERLAGLGQTVATAESCTGGLIGGALTAVPGASSVFLGGVIAYSNGSKSRDLGVDPAVLEREGAVSEPVARAMAEGARRRFGTDWGIGVTGIAGPGGGTPDKPVGLVHWAVAGPEETVARHRVFPGDRAYVRRATVAMALDLLRRRLGRAADDGD